ncbi:MAG: hypothetical protein AB1696_00110 [Planctomycetota bacterium]
MRKARLGMIVVGVFLLWGVTGAPVAAQEKADAQSYVKAQATRENDQLVWRVQMLDSYGEVKQGFAYPLTPDQTPAELREEFTTDYLPALPFDVDFAGGTAEAFLQHLRERLLNAYAKTPADLHPFLPEEPLSIRTKCPTKVVLQFPAIKAQAVSMTDLADTILPEIGEEIGVYLLFEGIIPDVAIEQGEPPCPHQWRLSLDDGGIYREVAAYNLSALPGKMSSNDVMAAFDAGWKITGNVIAVSVKFHEQTKTLILCGSDAEIDIADKIYSALKGESRTQHGGALEELLQELRDLRAELQASRSAKEKGVQ